jgi:hypothetical protein
MAIGRSNHDGAQRPEVVGPGVPAVEEPYRHNLGLDQDTFYFLYIGEVKALGLNDFLVESLQRIYGRPVDYISIVPDVLSQLPRPNTIVVNPPAAEARSRTGVDHNIRLSTGLFASEVSRCRFVTDLVDRLVERQGHVYVNVFESRPELSIVDGDRVRLVGPDPKLARSLNSKLNQYEMACRLGIPVPSGGCCFSLHEAAWSAREMIVSGHSVFFSQEYSAAGSNSMILTSVREIETRFSDPDCGYLVTRYLEHDHDPTVLGIVANENDVYIASVADQKIEGTRFKGSTFPTVLPDGTVMELKEMTRLVGRHLGELGYRGAFGCDYIVDPRGQVYFIEVNARKQGTTLETALTMKHRLPGHPSFPELEFEAVINGRFPRLLEEMDSGSGSICWGTYNYKAERDLVVTSDLGPMASEPELFRRAAGGDEGGGYTILDHVGKTVCQAPDGFLGRVIAVSADRNGIEPLLKMGIDTLRNTAREID